MAHGLHLKPQHANTAAAGARASAATRDEDGSITAKTAAGANSSNTESFYEFVIKVTRRKKGNGSSSRRQRSQADQVEQKQPVSAAGACSLPELSAEFLGMVSTSVTFPGLCDFQLLHATPIPTVELRMPLLSQPLALGSRAAAAAAAVNVGGCAFPASAFATPSDPFPPNDPGTTYQLAPLIFSRYDYAREYSFANHENANAAVKFIQAHMANPMQKPKARVTPENEEEQGGAAPVVPASPAKQRPLKSVAAAAAAAPASPSTTLAAAAATAAASAGADSDSDAGGSAGALDEEDEDAAAEQLHAGADDMDTSKLSAHLKRGRQPRRFFILYTDRTNTPKHEHNSRDQTAHKSAHYCSVCCVFLFVYLFVCVCVSHSLWSDYSCVAPS